MEQKIERVQKNRGPSYKLNYSLEAVQQIYIKYILLFFSSFTNIRVKSGLVFGD